MVMASGVCQDVAQSATITVDRPTWTGYTRKLLSSIGNRVKGSHGPPDLRCRPALSMDSRGLLIPIKSNVCLSLSSGRES
jgi:hypothetical protein